MRFLSGLLFVVAGTSVATAQIASRFDSGDEGWRIAGPNPTAHIASTPASVPVTWDSQNGLPAGSIRAADVYGWTWIMAPATYLGDKSEYYGYTLTYDILIRSTDNIAYPAVALQGESITLYLNTDSPSLNTWTSRSALLAEGEWRVNNYFNGAVATQAEVLSVLSDLRGLFILTEWATGFDDTNVDNIVMVLGPTECLGDIADDFGLTADEGGGPDGVVDFGDFAALLGLIGPCDGGVPGCLGDIADDFGLTADEGGGPDGVVDFGDFAALLGLIGPCP